MKNAKSLMIGMVAIFAVAFSVLAPAVNAFAHDRQIVVHNDRSVTMRELRGSNTLDGEWRFDFLGNRVIRAGRSEIVNIDDGSGSCRYDLKAVFTDGTEVIRWNVNVCERFAWYINPFGDRFA